MASEITRDIPAEHEKIIFGSFDSYLKKIERALNVDITEHNGTVRIISEGAAVNAERAAAVLDGLLALSEQNGSVTEQQVDYILSLSMEGNGQEKEMVEIDPCSMKHLGFLFPDNSCVYKNISAFSVLK